MKRSGKKNHFHTEQSNLLKTRSKSPNYINPLKYTPHDTVVTTENCNYGHSENYEKQTFSSKSLKFGMVYKTL